MKLSFDNARVAVAMRAARSALGMSQDDMADLLEMSRPSIYRLESFKMNVKGSSMIRALTFFHEHGIGINLYDDNKLTISINNETIQRLLNEGEIT